MCIVCPRMQACLFKLQFPHLNVSEIRNYSCLDLAHVVIRELPSRLSHEHRLGILWYVLRIEASSPICLTTAQPAGCAAYSGLFVTGSPSSVCVWLCSDVCGDKLCLL